MTSIHAFDRVCDYMEPDERDDDYEDDPDRDWDRTHDDIDWTQND